MRILYVHGIGGHPANGSWTTEIRKAIEAAYSSQNPTNNAIDVQFLLLDQIFLAFPYSHWDAFRALHKLFKQYPQGRFRDLRSDGGGVRMNLGMVAQWVNSENLRAATRDAFAAAVGQYEPNAVLGHSLGSLVAYDALTRMPSDGTELPIFVSLGSQIGNPFIVGQFGGRLSVPAAVRYWYHLYNSEDAVFTSPIHIPSNRFLMVDSHFDIGGMSDHKAEKYILNDNTKRTLWFRLAHERDRGLRGLYRESAGGLEGSFEDAGSPRVGNVALLRSSTVSVPPVKALSIGINTYQNPSIGELDGCVNDSFLVSEILQEVGVKAEDIKLLLQSRATTDNIKSMVDWLLHDVRSGGTRILHFSGHGTQLPSTSAYMEQDELNECLVPYDFDWTTDKAFLDKWFYSYYQNLPDDVNFIVLFDCCHSGGMNRASINKVRGINPPDDLHHNTIRWDKAKQMWVPRDDIRRESIVEIGKSMPHSLVGDELKELNVVPSSSTKLSNAYSPLIFAACSENQYAEEYAHGSIPYGVFTYTLLREIRNGLSKDVMPSYGELFKNASLRLKEMKYQQTPVLYGKPDAINSRLPK